MKKIFILGFALFILITVGCVGETPSTENGETIENNQNPGRNRLIEIWSIEQLEELQQIVLEYSDEEFYQRSQLRDEDFCFLTYQFGSREQAVDFLELVDSLAIPDFPMVDKNIRYLVGGRSINVLLILAECEFSEDASETIRLEFWFDEAIINEHFEETTDGGNSLVYQNRAEGMAVYASTADEPLEHSLSFWIVYNDVPIFARHFNHSGNNTGRGEISIAEMMEGVSMVTVAELQETMAEQRAESAARQETE